MSIEALIKAVKENNVNELRTILIGLNEGEKSELHHLAINANEYGFIGLGRYSLKFCSIDLVKALLDNNAIKSNAENIYKLLQFAISDSTGLDFDRHLDRVKALLEVNVVKECVANNKYAYGEMLNDAVLNGRVRVVQVLLKTIFEKDKLAISKSDVLVGALHSSNMLMFKWLLDEVEGAADAQGHSALCVAAKKGNLDAVVALLQIEEVKNKVHKRSNKVLCTAAEHGHAGIVQMLLEIDKVKAKVTANNNQALCDAAKNGHADIVEMLLQIDAVKDNVIANNNQAFCCAVANGHADIVKMLIKIDAVRKYVGTLKANCKSINLMLTTAIKSDDSKFALALLQVEDVKSAVGSNANQMLCRAVKRGNRNIVKALLEIDLVKDNVTANGNQALCDAAKKGYLDIVELLLEVDAVKVNAAAKNNQVLCKAAKNGNKDIVKMLLKIDAVKVNIAANDNLVLREASKYGWQNIVKTLIEIEEVKVNAAVKGNEALCNAAEHGHLEIVEALLEIECVKVKASENDNKALRSAANRGHMEIVMMLLKIEDVHVNAAVENNEALCSVAKWGHVGAIKKLLKIKSVNESADANDNKALSNAAINRHFEVVMMLLEIGVVQASAAAVENRALRFAVIGGDIRIVDALLKINAVKENAAVKNNEALINAIKNSHNEIVEALVVLPAVIDYLLRQDGKPLIDILKSIPLNSQVWPAFNKMPIYGLAFSQLSNDGGKLQCLSNIQSFCISPEKYLEKNTDYSLAQRQAVKILKSYQDVRCYEQMLEEERLMMLQVQNVDDEKTIGAVLNHFEKVIKPFFSRTFDSRGASLESRIEDIESEIRALLLSRMKMEAKNRLLESGISEEENSMLKARIAYIENHGELLKLGHDKDLMDGARVHFSSNADNNQVAWRAYDRWAPCSKQWPNLLTAPLGNKGEEGAYSVKILGPHNLSEASLKTRELIAFSFCLVIDEQGSDADAKKDRIENFIGQLTDIRRAHNSSNEGMDDPSCFPGIVGRLGLMWSMHSLAIRKRMVELLPGILRPKLVQVFSSALMGCNSQEKEVLYNCLVMLRKENAQNIIDGKILEFVSENNLAQKRMEFINSLGKLDELQEYVNNELKEMHVDDELSTEKLVYLLQYLADIGGGWSAQAITGIYMKSNQEEISIKEEIEIEEEDVIFEERILNPFVINAFLRKIRSSDQIKVLEQKATIWERLFPLIQRHVDLPKECLQEIVRFICIDWVSCAGTQMDFAFSGDTLEELNGVGADKVQTLFELVWQEYVMSRMIRPNEITEVYTRKRKKRDDDSDSEKENPPLKKNKL